MSTYGLTDRVSIGLGFNSPFGLTTKPGQTWAGMFYSRELHVFTLNANPNDRLSRSPTG